METLSHSESGHLYSWWWDSHISPKNSKWLKENLTDMDAKVKAMIKLIEEDADSFARRAEMYFKKHPKLIKLVEEFYRAYRALAERYDHATAELRHAHKTMAKAFPNEENHILTDDSLCDAAESHTQEVPHPICASLEPAFEFSSMHNMSKQNTRTLEEFEDGGSRKGLKQNVKIQNCSESEHPGRAESEVQTLRKALAKIQSDKDAIFLQYQKSLEKLSEMERDLIKAQKDAGGLDERASKYEIEIKILKEALAELKTEKDAGLVQYNQCLESIANLEIMLSMAHMDAKGLDERAGKAEIEAKDLKRELTSEKDAGLLQNKLYLEKISVLEAKITLAEDNYRMLNEQIERAGLEVKALRESLAQLNEEKESVAAHYHQCLEQLQTLGLNPECFATSVKDLQNENSKLKEACKMECDEKEALREKAKDFDELLIKNAFMEFSLYGLNAELDELRATVKKLQESCQVLQEEKSIIVAESEKSTLLSQLQTITESMPKLLETNTLLEKSLSDANNELDGLKAQSRRLEESYKSLNDEKYNLLNERSIRVSQLESVEARLGNLEKRFTKLEEKYSDVEMEKESTDNLVEELHDSILVQQEKHANHKPSSEARLRNLVNLVHALQEEQRLGKTEFEEQLDKAVNAQLEMFILQSCIGDLEQKNLALLFECEKHVEASKFSEEVISELETENLMQLMEVEFLSHEIRKFKKGIHQVCGALQIDPDGEHDKGIKQEGIPISHILHNIEDLKSSLVKIQEEKQQLLVKNSVLQTSLWQHRSEGEKLESEKRMLEQEFENMRELNEILQKDKVELLEMNKQLRFEVANGEEKENTLKSDLADLHVELIDLRRTNQVFQEEKSKLLEEKNSLLKSVSDLQDAMSTAEDENSLILQEVLALRNLSFVYECFVTEKVVEQEALSEHLSNLSHMNSDLKQELGVLSNKFEVKEAENAYLNESFERMDKELQEAENANGHLTHQIENSEHLVMKKEAELLEMEKRLKAADMLNAEFCRYIEELKMEQKESRVVKENLDRQILELSENCKSHKKEIEQHRVREETLNSDLLGKTNEFELLEAEAAAFYFDLQILSTSEALLESKVNELTGICKRLDDESAAKSLVIEQMTERVSLLQSEIRGLKGQLWAYIPVITSLKEDFASLEHTCLLWTNKTCVVGNGEQKGVVIETCLQENSYQSLRENKSTSIPDGVSDLLSMQTRIRAVEKVMTEEIERHVKEENLSANVEAGTLTEVTEDSNLEVATYDHRNVVMELKELNAWRTKSENWSMMKDIPLDHNSDDPESKYCKREHSGNGDQILELCETSQQCCAPTESDNSERYCPELEVEKELGVDNLELSKATTETTQDGKRKILERLASDAQKLAILNMTVQDLKKKPVTKKKSNKGNDIEHETVKKQIEQVEEAVKELADTNDQLTKDIEESSSSSMGEQVQRRRVTEQARSGSEQIGRLQLEVQNIQYILLKLVDEKNNKGKNRLTRPIGVLLRDFIHIGKKNSRRRSKMCLCGCSRPSTNED